MGETSLFEIFKSLCDLLRQRYQFDFTYPPQCFHETIMRQEVRASKALYRIGYSFSRAPTVPRARLLEGEGPLVWFGVLHHSHVPVRFQVEVAHAEKMEISDEGHFCPVDISIHCPRIRMKIES